MHKEKDLPLQSAVDGSFRANEGDWFSDKCEEGDDASVHTYVAALS